MAAPVLWLLGYLALGLLAVAICRHTPACRVERRLHADRLIARVGRPQPAARAAGLNPLPPAPRRAAAGRR